MTQRGGSTNQSGVYYQNSISALYLGRLCDTSARSAEYRVASVRIEAPSDVDDTIVEFADSHLGYLQMKENLETSGDEWNKLWQNFSRQFKRPSFKRSSDRLHLYTSDSKETFRQLKDACERARESRSQDEWLAGLNEKQCKLVDKIEALLEAGTPAQNKEVGTLSDDVDVGTPSHVFFGHVEVSICTLEQLERDWVPYWIPPSNQQPATVFRLLRDRVGKAARHKGTLVAQALRDELEREHCVGRGR